MPTPTLDTAFQVFASWQTVLFCLGIAIATYVIRSIVETAWKGAKANDYWNEAVRVGPIGTGVLLVFVAQFPWPTQLAGSKLGLAFYGAACGVASAYVYASFRGWLNTAAKAGFAPAQKFLKMPPSTPVATDGPPVDAAPPAVDAPPAERATPTDPPKAP